MARQNINVGATGNDKTGDPLRTAFIKTNSNFTELYTNVATITTNMNIPVDYEDILNAPTDISDLTDTTGILIPEPPTSLVNNSKQVTLNSAGTLIVPYLTGNAFELMLSAANYVPTLPKPTLPLIGSPWSFNAEISYTAAGIAEIIIDDGPLPSATNPGYATGDVFTFGSSVHGIPNYTLTITLSDVINVGFVIWTATLTAGNPPEYPSTIKSLGAIKFTADDNSLVLGSNGSLILPSGSPILFGGNASIQSVVGSLGSFNISSENGVEIETVNAVDPLNPIATKWNFGLNGVLTLPADSPILFGTGNSLIQSGGGSLNISSETDITIEAIDTSDALNPVAKLWSFGTDSILTLPVNGDIVNSNGVSVLGGAGITPTGIANGTTSVEIQSANGNVDIIVGGVSTYTFSDTNRFSLPDASTIVQNNAQTTTLRTNMLPGVGTVIHTANSAYTGYKLVITVEGTLDGDGTSTRHTQTCEATIAAIYNSSVEPVISVYGIIYTSLTPLATFTVRRGIGNAIEVVALNSQSLETLHASVHAVSFVSYYD